MTLKEILLLPAALIIFIFLVFFSKEFEDLLTQTAEVPFRKVGDECVTKRFIYSKNNYEM
jgi:hypothetical protein